MKLKTIPLFALSFGVLSGCTNSCQGSKPATPTTEQNAVPAQAPEAPSTSEQAAPSTTDEAATDETSASDTVASAETPNE